MGKGIASRSENYSQWYNDIVLKAELADYAPVRGCMVIRPYGFATEGSPFGSASATLAANPTQAATAQVLIIFTDISRKPPPGCRRG